MEHHTTTQEQVHIHKVSGRDLAEVARQAWTGMVRDARSGGFEYMVSRTFDIRITAKGEIVGESAEFTATASAVWARIVMADGESITPEETEEMPRPW